MAYPVLEYVGGELLNRIGGNSLCLGVVRNASIALGGRPVFFFERPYVAYRNYYVSLSISNTRRPLMRQRHIDSATLVKLYFCHMLDILRTH